LAKPWRAPGHKAKSHHRFQRWGVRVSQSVPRAAGGDALELARVSQRLRDLDTLRKKGESLQLRMQIAAQQAMIQGLEDDARAALVRKAEAAASIEEVDAKMVTLQRLQRMLQEEVDRQAALRGVRDAIELDNQSVLMSPPVPLEPPRFANFKNSTYQDFAVFLPQLAGCLLKLRPVRRVWSNPIQALGGLKDVSDAQRKARAEWDSSTTSISLESAANLPQLQKQDALFAVGLVESAYKGPDSVAWFAELSDEGIDKGLQVLQQIVSARLHQPAFCVLRCSSSSVGEELVVAVRGLDDVTDVLTASEAEAAPLLDGYCHRGALLSALWLMDQLEPLLRRHSPDMVHFVGHSLGGAVVSAVAALLHSDPRYRDCLPSSTVVRATTFGCPPTVHGGPTLLRALRQRVTSYVNGDDIVSRLSEFNVEVLLGQAEQCQRVGVDEYARLLAQRRRDEKNDDDQWDADSSNAAFSRARASLSRSPSFTSSNPVSPQLLIPGRIFRMQVEYGVPTVQEVSAELMAEDCIPLLPNCIRDHRLFSYRETLELL